MPSACRREAGLSPFSPHPRMPFSLTQQLPEQTLGSLFSFHCSQKDRRVFFHCSDKSQERSCLPKAIPVLFFPRQKTDHGTHGWLADRAAQEVGPRGTHLLYPQEPFALPPEPFTLPHPKALHTPGDERQPKPNAALSHSPAKQRLGNSLAAWPSSSSPTGCSRRWEGSASTKGTGPAR